MARWASSEAIEPVLAIHVEGLLEPGELVFLVFSCRANFGHAVLQRRQLGRAALVPCDRRFEHGDGFLELSRGDQHVGQQDHGAVIVGAQFLGILRRRNGRVGIIQIVHEEGRCRSEHVVAMVVIIAVGGVHQQEVSKFAMGTNGSVEATQALAHLGVLRLVLVRLFQADSTRVRSRRFVPPHRQGGGR